MRALVRWVALCLLVLLGSPVGRAHAAPRITQRLDNVTLHETLRHLHSVYGWDLTTPEGQGRDRYEDRPNARRASFDWLEAAPGTILRDVARSFGVTPRVAGRGAVVFMPEPLRSAGISVNRDGVVATLFQVKQVEERAQAAKVSTPDIWRSVSLGIGLRPVNGDSDSFFGIERLRAQDDQGNEMRAVLAEEPLRRPQWVEGATADEWPLNVQFIGIPARARRLVWVEGDAVFYRSSESRRLEMPLTAEPLPAAWSMGAVRFRSADLRRKANTLEGSFVVAYPRDVEVNSDAEPRWGYAMPLVRLRGGALVRLPTPAVEQVDDPEGGRALRLTLEPSLLPDEPVALLWDLVVRSQPERKVAFRFANIPLPIDQDRDPGIPPGRARGTGVLSLQLRPNSLPWNGELAVGLARKTVAGWGPVRWTTVEASDEGDATVAALAPGAYRVHLTFRVRDGQGRLGPPAPLKPAVSDLVTVKPGATATLRATR